MKRNQVKISITVSPELADNLAYLTGRLGVSRSAMISELLTEPVASMRKLFAQVPLDPTNLTGPELVRFRGESEAIVRERLAQLEGMAHDLFSE